MQGYEIYQRDSNYYSLLDVGRGSTPLEIKKAYKKMSLELHPDKNKSPTAGDEFARLKDAYDVSRLDVVDWYMYFQFWQRCLYVFVI